MIDGVDEAGWPALDALDWIIGWRKLRTLRGRTKG